MWSSTRFSTWTLAVFIVRNYIGHSISCSTVKLFADDTNLFIYGKSPEDLQAAAMHEITLLSEWFIANKLSLSINKSCYTVFGASSKEKLHINLNIGNTVLQQVEFCKYLWVYVDSDLSWQHHIDFIYNKIIKFTSIFIRYGIC